MNKLFLICGLVLSFFAKSNEISFKSVDDLKGGSIEINFILEKVSFIKSYSLENPSRIVMDVYDSDLLSAIDEPYNYPIKKIRATSKDNITRIVVDLYEYVNWIKPKQIKNDKGVLLSLQISKNKKLKSSIRDIVVAIDAGHGGKYPGAVGTNNILEKDVTLLIAKELQRTLRDTEGYSPVMIREGDETVALNDADILISIHADGFRLESVKGASVFIWSEEASSSVARNLSEKQRKRIQADIKNIMEDDFNEDAARKAYPEIYKQKIKDSEILGEKILNELKKDPYTKIHKKNVEYADFRVLKSIDIPSVLVESGFMTNPEDAERLKGKPGRRMIARSIFLGIHNYFLENPLEGTFVEDNPDYLNYEIQKGDVLSEIAIRFGVTVESINKLNNLENRSIFPGQIIRINI